MNGSFKAALSRARAFQRAAAVDRRKATAPVTLPGQSGPCPAVALATLAGWPYHRAAEFLKPYGFRGHGLVRSCIDEAVRRATGRELRAVPAAGSVAATVRERFASQRLSGLVYCHGHVMPVVRGVLLNGDPFRDRLCDKALVLEGGA